MEIIFQFLEKWGILGVLSLATIYYLVDKYTAREAERDRCHKVHTELEKDVNEKFEEIKESIKIINDSMIEFHATTKQRLDGFDARMTNHYQENGEQWVAVMEKLQEMGKK